MGAIIGKIIATTLLKEIFKNSFKEAAINKILPLAIKVFVNEIYNLIKKETAKKV